MKGPGPLKDLCKKEAVENHIEFQMFFAIMAKIKF